ncbi:MAG: Tryptophan synthase alpha chain, partial [bacterium]|nr:Tryptophan synthase alpha chain [bacterium]
SYDANGDGIINTDCNGDGIPDSLSNVTAAKPCIGGTLQEFFGLDDECLLFTTNTGAEGGTGRPLALGQGSTDFAPSDAWAGRFTDGVFYRIDGTTGLVKATLPLTVGGVAARPYGAAIDQTGILWAPNVEGTTLYFADTNNPANINKISPPTPIAGASGFYGIAIDGFKTPLTAGGQPQLMQDIWIATISSPHMVRYTPLRTGGFGALGNGKWTDFTWTGATGNGRGVGVDNRAPTSFAWLALDGSNALGQVAVDANFALPDGTVTQQTITLPAAQVYSTNGGVTTLGAGVAADLDLWGVNQSNDATSANKTNATHFHVDAAGNVTPPTVADQVRLDDNGLTPGGAAHRGPYPYTYSDFTGFGLRNFTNPHGSYSYVWTGCGVGKTKWIGVTWDAATPPGTAISMKARSTDDKSTFSTAPFTGNYTMSPADLRMPAPAGGAALTPNPSGFLQVEFDLTTTDKNSTPALKSYTVVYECVNGIG